MGGYEAVRPGQRNASGLPRRFGCLVFRRDRCVLARSDGGRLYIPAAEAENLQTAEQAATRAVATACDIYEEEIALLDQIAPAVVYDTDAIEGAPAMMMSTVTIFAAIAVGTPPPEAEEEDEDDPYDWFTYEQAMARLTTSYER